MNWHALKFKASSTEAARLSDILISQGALSVAIENADDYDPVFQYELAEEMVLWQANTVSGMFHLSADLKAIARYAGIDDFIIENIEEQDWVRQSQSQFNPIQISSRLWIAPSWHEVVDPKAINLVLDPGLAFGTGSHPTTRLCLAWLAEHIKGGESVLDYGCGSGILAIAAAKLGAGRVIGADIDPLAVKVSQENAKKNKINAEFYLVDSLPEFTADVVLANILAQPLKLLALMLAERTASQGVIVLSGILSSQVDAITEHYKKWFEMCPPVVAEEWACLTGKKTSSDDYSLPKV